MQFILLQVDGDTSTNDSVIALASGLSGSTMISSFNSHDAQQLQGSLDAVYFSIISFSYLNEKINLVIFHFFYKEIPNIIIISVSLAIKYWSDPFLPWK